jgi:hypothetical protein
MEGSAVIHKHVVRFLNMYMVVAHYLMEYAAKTMKPAAPHTILVFQEAGVKYVQILL